MTNKSNSSAFYSDLEKGNWENKPPIVLNPFKRDQAKKGLKALIALAMVTSILFISMEEFKKYSLMPAQQQLNNDTIKPEMTKLANTGKTSAILWMAESYPETELHRLDPLIEQKNSEAMLLKAQMLYDTDKAKADEYMNAAAAEGNPKAVKHLSEKNPNDIGLANFLTQYVFK